MASHSLRSQFPGLKKNIHIIPLGFEYERAVAPFEVINVDEVVIVTDQNSKPQIPYTQKVVAYFENKGVRVSVEHADIFDLNDTLRVISSLIKHFKEAGHLVSVNVSSCGRLVSIAASQAGHAHDAVIYYVKASSFSAQKKELQEFGVSRCSMSDPDITILPNIVVNYLSEEEALVLETIYVNRVHGVEWTKNIEIAQMMHAFRPLEFPWDPNGGENPFMKDEEGYEEFRMQQWDFNSKFKKKIGNSLLDRGCMEQEPRKKNVRYQLTPTGEYALFLFGISGRIGFDEEKGKVVYKGE